MSAKTCMSNMSTKVGATPILSEHSRPAHAANAAFPQVKPILHEHKDMYHLEIQRKERNGGICVYVALTNKTAHANADLGADPSFQDVMESAAEVVVSSATGSITQNGGGRYGT